MNNKCKCRIWGDGTDLNRRCTVKAIGGSPFCKKHKKIIKEENGWWLGFIDEPYPKLPCKPHPWKVSSMIIESDTLSNNSDDLECNVSDVDFTELSINITNSLTKTEKKKGGIFFTPKSIIKQDIDYILSIKSDIKTILEPSCGSCEFIDYLDTKLTDCEIDGVELNSTIYDQIKGKFNKDKITICNKDFLKLPFSKRYDLICGNPPYFVYSKENISKEYD